MSDTDRYGGYDLRRGDDDRERVWGGEKRAEAPKVKVSGAPAAQDRLGAPHYVRTLHQDLRELGFWLVKKKGKTFPGAFDLTTELAVREFQIYARRKEVATEDLEADAKSRYTDRLSAFSNDEPYVGPVSGVVNEATRKQLARWLELNLCCPVVIEAWEGKYDRAKKRWTLTKPHQSSHGPGKDGGVSNAGNLWHHKDMRTKAKGWGPGKVAVFARDFSRAGGALVKERGVGDDRLLVIGDYFKAGPRSLPRFHSTPEAEMSPFDWIGEQAATTGAAASTYKVIRAMSTQENGGFLDGLNAWDNAFLSVGPFHSTMGLTAAGKVEQGELGGALAYVKYASPESFREVFEDGFGFTISGAFGRDVAEVRRRVYPRFPALKEEDGAFRALEEGRTSATKEVKVAGKDGACEVTVRVPAKRKAPRQAEIAPFDWFRSWHWFYRFQMLARESSDWRSAWWDLGRIRLRDIFEADWGPTPALYVQPDPKGPKRPATVGDVFTSELAAGWLLRIHARGAGFMFRRMKEDMKLPHVVGDVPERKRRCVVTSLLSDATAGLPRNCSEWGDEEEEKVLAGLERGIEAHGRLRAKMLPAIRDWPGKDPHTLSDEVAKWMTSAGSLSKKRGSFWPDNFHDSDLPERVFPRSLRDLAAEEAAAEADATAEAAAEDPAEEDAPLSAP